MKKIIISFLILVLFYSSCAQESSTKTQAELEPILVNDEYIHKAYFASGCFWCVEAIFSQLEGVNSVISGYCNGTTKNPTYESICSGNTGHAEVCKIDFNPDPEYTVPLKGCLPINKSFIAAIASIDKSFEDPE